MITAQIENPTVKATTSKWTALIDNRLLIDISDYTEIAEVIDWPDEWERLDVVLLDKTGTSNPRYFTSY